MRHLLRSSLMVIVTGLLGLGTVSAQTPQGPSVQDLQVELVTPIKAKKAKAGDAISAVTVTSITLPQGVVVPAGSKVLGHVRQVEPDSGEGHVSFIALAFEEVGVKKGQTVPLNCFVRAALMPALKGVMAQGTEQGQPMAPMSAPDRGMGGGSMGNMGMGGGTMGGMGMGGTGVASMGPALPSAPQPQEAPKPVAAHNGQVIGMRGVELQVNVPQHLSMFRSGRKNLELDEGLQLMLVVQP